MPVKEKPEPSTVPANKATMANQQEGAVPDGEMRMDVKGMIPSVAELRALAPGLVADALAGVILLSVYALLFSHLLPDGINRLFTSKLQDLLLLPMVILSLSVVSLARRQHRFAAVPSTRAWFEARDLPLLLLPMAPIAQYIVRNLDSLSALHGVAVFCGFSALAFLLTFLLPMALSAFGSRSVLFLTGLAFSYTLFNMPAVAAYYHWHTVGRLHIQLPLMTLVFSLSLVVYCLDRRFLRIAAYVFFAACIVPEIGKSKTIYRSEENSNEGRPKLREFTGGRKAKNRPNIFLLVYESYLGNETMLAHGIDNSDQEYFLKGNGFHIYKGVWSLDSPTMGSMSLVLGQRGWSHDAPRGVAVQTVFADNGYSTAGIFPSSYFLQGNLGSYDCRFPIFSSASALVLFRQVLAGVFRFDGIYHHVDYQEFLSKKLAVLANESAKPTFLYTHSRYPGHSQNSGRAIGDEVELYRKGLRCANEEMRVDVTTAIKNRPGAVVIVCGDHGPYLTKKNCAFTGGAYDITDINRLDIQDRYGCFLAIRWPEGASIDHSRISVLQDVFPAVFSWMYEEPAMWGLAMERMTRLRFGVVSGVRVRNGMIEGGIDDGKPLFESRASR